VPDSAGRERGGRNLGKDDRSSRLVEGGDRRKVMQGRVRFLEETAIVLFWIREVSPSGGDAKGLIRHAQNTHQKVLQKVHCLSEKKIGKRQRRIEDGVPKEENPCTAL